MYNLSKRIMDFILSLIVIVVVSPVMIVIALFIKFDSKGPIIFKQKRPGLRKEIFTIYKFRTMKTDTPNLSTEKLGDPSRYVTKLGLFLRKSSLDELPQLFNILFGEMSIVGPRPALYNQEDLISLRDENGINNLKPGLTGYAQVKGRDNITDIEKVRYEEYYKRNMSMWLDIKIIWWTFKSVLKSEGVRVN
ncbi:lipid carrier--UDP-N-acetylgalactosaminyltransferase [Planococcus antarcticus DSM 14505]|uniref:Lipid carrier--UDP-N-acetylgalactosaminyltransferase n=1 Tax=Planococcus antarcticus DSM 14505 TaxID=1185653 RepID=A0ABM6D3M6_9BACL|nr:sugar transferase [Planococcus antarcticus]ANU10119.1 lipid carrier--UDP-N-acetylgalactosaminyltransferase [Planococcus antarcticus DSM 14505]